MTNLVKAGTIEAQSSAMDLALRTASKLKDARGLLPETLKSEGEIVAVLLAGQELGIPPMAALRGLQVVRGKVIISYDTMIALLRRASYRVEWLESTATKAVLRLTAPDGTTHVEAWDQERAKRAGLWGKGTWSQYPETMLRARCVSSGARAFAGEVLSGVYVEGELDAIKPAPAPVVTITRSEAPQSEPDVVDNVAPTDDAIEALIRAFDAASTKAEHTAARSVAERIYGGASPEDQARITAASKAAVARIKASAPAEQKEGAA